MKRTTSTTRHTGCSLYIGIDNGVTGSIGFIKQTSLCCQCSMIRIPTITVSEQDYTKKRNSITRIQADKLRDVVCGFLEDPERTMCGIERPMINPRRWKATMSAIRAFELVLYVIKDQLRVPVVFLDSREWQRNLLPHGTGDPDLKRMSRDIGTRMYPYLQLVIEKHGDADGVLIAEYLRRMYTGRV